MQNNNQINKNQNNQKNRINQKNKQNDSLNKQQDFQFEMGNELGADIEQEKTMFKNEYCKDKLISNNQKKRQNNNFHTNKNQFK